MDFLDIIKERRSIRIYKEKMPSDKEIDKLLEAGRWAPSGLNNQPWKFKVISNKKIKDEISKFTKYSAIIKKAPVIICVFLDISASYNRDKDIMAIGACIQNILLAAHSIGLGTCWLGEILNKKQEFVKFLGVDTDYELMAVITVGFPDGQVKNVERRPIKELIIN